MTAPVLDLEPACPGSDPLTSDPEPAIAPALLVEASSVAAIPAAMWDRMAARNPWATPFSSHAVHAAWWRAYGANAHEQTLVVRDAADPRGELVAIVPLMHRHEVEPDDLATHTRMRGESHLPSTPVAPHAKAIFFGATYHSDYATVLADPADLPRVAEAVADHLSHGSVLDPHPSPWDVIDLRRLRCGDPTADAMADAFGRREMSEGWTLNLEREDVCPVVTLPGRHADGTPATFDEYLATLAKKSRHEIRRKLRRAEGAGEVRLEDSADPVRDLELFIDLHQRKWGARGLFPDTPGGAQSRVFFRCLFEGFGAGHCKRHPPVVPVGRRPPCRCRHRVRRRRDGGLLQRRRRPRCPRALAGVLLVAALAQRALADGRSRLDFLRGDEGYKYEWGAVDEPIQRLLVRRA